MAFFGLTALGPQNTFKSSLRDFSYLDVFTPVDRERAFSVVDTEDRGYLNKEQVRGATIHVVVVCLQSVVMLNEVAPSDPTRKMDKASSD